MGASANDRHRLHARLEQLLGADDAATLMEHLPPSPWDDLATRADIRSLRDELRTNIAEMRTDMRELRKDQRDSTRILFFSTIASQATLVGLVLAATRLG
jgi:hypothetical protein